MSDSLYTGQFYGSPQRRTELGGVVLTEVVHTRGRKLPCHTHESAYFGLLLSGSYSERCTHRATEYAPFTRGFHPAFYPPLLSIAKQQKAIKSGVALP